MPSTSWADGPISAPGGAILRHLANHGHPNPLSGDWFRHGHVKQVCPLSFEEMPTSEGLWGITLFFFFLIDWGDNC